jgi:tetratricopeptide (TPR) repeat protein
MKKALILLMAMLVVLFSFLNAAPPPQQEEEKDAEKLIDKASYCYGILEDYPRALKYLEQAVKLAKDSHLKADALLKTAYVHFLMGKNASQYETYIQEALKLDASLQLDRVYYRDRFIQIFNAFKESPGTSAEKIQTRLYREEKEKRAASSRFFVNVNVGYLMSIDEDFKTVYGNGSVFPQVKAGFRIARNFYIWGGYGTVSATGTVPEVNSDAKTSQNFLSVGLKYSRDFSGKLGFKLEAAAVNISYTEEALELEIKDSAKGFGVELGLLFNMKKRLYTEVSAGFISATDLVLNKKIKLGGFKTGLGVGVRF